MGTLFDYDEKPSLNGNRPSLKDEPLWCLVDDGCLSTCVTLLGETREVRDNRHKGELLPNAKVVLREMDGDLVAFVNKVRNLGEFDNLVQLVAMVSSEATQLEARKIREQKATSSIL